MKTKLVLLISLLFSFCTSNEGQKEIVWNSPPPIKGSFKSITETSSVPYPSGKVYVGNDTYIASYNNRLYRINYSTKVYTHIAGNGTDVYSDGTLLSAGIPTAKGIGIDSNNILYILYLNQIVKINEATNNVSSFVLPTPLSGIITSQFVNDTGATIYYTLANDSRVYQINTATGVSSIHAGGATGDSTGSLIGNRFTSPEIFQTSSGYTVVDFYAMRIKSVEGSDVLNRSCQLKGTSMTSSLGVDGPVDKCTYGYITSYFYNHATGEIYFIESWSVIRKMNQDGSVVTLGKPFSLNNVEPIYNIIYANNRLYFNTNGAVYEAELQ